MWNSKALIAMRNQSYFLKTLSLMALGAQRTLEKRLEKRLRRHGGTRSGATLLGELFTM
jgi:hypothetical protein